MDDLRENIRSQVRRAMDVTGLTSSQLARKAGLVPSTLNNFLNRDVKHNLSMSTLNKIHAAVMHILAEKGNDADTIRNQIEYFQGTTPPPKQDSPAGPAVIDAGFLTDVIRKVSHTLHENNITIPEDARAEIISLTYKTLAESGGTTADITPMLLKSILTTLEKDKP